MKYLRVRNFEKFQHYKDRRPPWIKLYRDLWNDPRFFELNESERYFLISFFVIASQNDNKVPANSKWLQREMATSRSVPVERLIASDWLEWCDQGASTDASKPLPFTRSRETEVQRQNTETEGEGDCAIAPEMPEPVLTFGEYENVRMTAKEWNAVQAKLGTFTDDYITRLDHYARINPPRFRKYKDHHLVIMSWHDKDLREGKLHAKQNESREQAKVRRNAEAARKAIEFLDGGTGDYLGGGDYTGESRALPETTS
jgi:hypothetical protein